MENHPKRAITLSIDPCEYGYTLIAKDYENGFHRGQNDDPVKIYKALREKGYDHIVFMIDDVGQFDISFSVYYKSLNDSE
jgi:hypothetical protein